MNIKKNFLLLCFILSVVMCHGEIRTIDNLEPLAEELRFSDQDTLILIDLGNTLLKEKDALLHVKYLPWIANWYKSNYPGISRTELRNIMASCKAVQTSGNFPILYGLRSSLKLEN